MTEGSLVAVMIIVAYLSGTGRLINCLTNDSALDRNDLSDATTKAGVSFCHDIAMIVQKAT